MRIALALALALALPGIAHAQTRAGVVTTAQGQVSVTRVATAQAAPLVLPLQFKQDVFFQDVIRTQDQSLARILLGGKAVVTVREHSTLRINEAQDAATIQVEAGRIALAVAKEKMGTTHIDVRTPNAVAGVRGTVMITEVTPQDATTPPTSTFTLITGVVDVSLLDPAGNRVGSPFMLNPLQVLGVVGFTPPPPPRNITAAQAKSITNTFQAKFKQPPTGANQQVTDRQIQQASNAVGGAGVGGAGVGGGFPTFTAPPSGTTNQLLPPEDMRTGTGGNPTGMPGTLGGGENHLPCRNICACNSNFCGPPPPRR